MENYNEAYCRNHDIDYFLSIDGVPYHIASYGSDLPCKIDREDNLALQKKVYAEINGKRFSFEKDGIETKEQSVKRILNDNWGSDQDIRLSDISDYLVTFIEFARLGFISCDTIEERLIVLAVPDDSKSESFAKSLNLPEIPKEQLYPFEFDDSQE